eukprot:s136_g19.t1
MAEALLWVNQLMRGEWAGARVGPDWARGVCQVKKRREFLGNEAEGVTTTTPDANADVQVEKIHDHRLKGKLLEQAAMQAAALAVAEETAAAKAASGGEPSSARFLASARLKHMRDRAHRGDLAKVTALSARFEVVNESHANGSAHANNASVPSGTKSKEGINPFNPFTNPFFNPFTPNPYTPMHSGGGGFKGNLLFIMFLVVLAVSFCAITFGGIMDDDEDSSGDDSIFGGLNRLDMDGARRKRGEVAKKLTRDENKRTCSSCFSCFGWKCPTTVVIFTIVAVFVTVLGGKILWSCGILQPLLAQLLLYAYVILIIFGFVAVITHELTRKVRKMIGGIYQNLSDVTEVMPGFMRKKGNASPRF